MAGEILSPNMSLPVPGVGVTSGPQYASDINTCLSIIDSHSHTAGSGVPITPAAININANLPFNSNNITGLNALTLSVANGTPSNQSIYVAGVDLYYIDGSGNIIQITKGAAVFATSSGITSGTNSAAFVSNVLVVHASSTSSANIDVASVVFRNVSPNTFGLTVSPPILGANSALTLPLPAASVTSFVTIDTSGNMGTATGIPATQIAANSITGSQLSNTVDLPAGATYVGTHFITNHITNLQIIRGSFNANTGAILTGEDYSTSFSTSPFANTTINFSNAFGNSPAVVISVRNQAATGIFVGSSGVTNAVVNNPSGFNVIVDFIAIG